MPPPKNKLPRAKPEIHTKPLIGSGIDKRTKRRLQQGKIFVEASLDLHGFNQEQAFDALCHFVKTAQQQNKKILLVITGRGRFSKSGQSVLKNKLPEWLRSFPLNKWVLDYTIAKPKDGGAGAYYLRVRRIK